MLPVLRISDPFDPRVAAFRDIRERDLVGRDKQFIAEGEVVLRALVNGAMHEPQALLLAEKRVAKLEPLLARLPGGVPVYSAPQDILDTIAGFHLHRGILALGRRAAEQGPAALLAGLPARALVVLLVGIANHDNMGGIFRNAAAFGADAILLDAQSCDPLYRKSIRVSAGAALTVPFARLSPGEDAVDSLESAGFTAFALSPSGERPLAEISPPSRAAVLFGAEGPGLPEAVLGRTETVRIPMTAGFDSLNVATSSGIVLHHCAFARS